MYKKDDVDKLASILDETFAVLFSSSNSSKFMRESGWLVYADMLEASDDANSLKHAQAIRHTYNLISVAETMLHSDDNEDASINFDRLYRTRLSINSEYDLTRSNLSGFIVDVMCFGLYARKIYIDAKDGITAYPGKIERKPFPDALKNFLLDKDNADNFRFLESVEIKHVYDVLQYDELLNALPLMRTLKLDLTKYCRPKSLSKFFKKQVKLRKIKVACNMYNTPNKNDAILDIICKSSFAKIEELTIDSKNYSLDKTYTKRLNGTLTKNVKKLTFIHNIYMYSNSEPSLKIEASELREFINVAWNFSTLESLELSNIEVFGLTANEALASGGNFVFELTKVISRLLMYIPDFDRLKEITLNVMSHHTKLYQRDADEICRNIKLQLSLKDDTFLKINAL